VWKRRLAAGRAKTQQPCRPEPTKPEEHEAVGPFTRLLIIDTFAWGKGIGDSDGMRTYEIGVMGEHESQSRRSQAISSSLAATTLRSPPFTIIHYQARP
jgi:hypothetical protein